MGNYSKEEIRAFKLKDKMNCRMSALKAVSLLYEGCGADYKDGDKDPVITTVKSVADEFYQWLRQDQDDVGGDTPDMSLGSEPAGTTLGQLPEPTLQQKKVVDAIVGKLGLLQADPQLKSHILDWAEAAHGQRSYPTKLDSVERFLTWNNN